MNQLTILDGGMGRELKRLGAPFSQPLWSAQALMEAPDYIIEAHQGFIDAGAEIITVNSYACVPFHLGETLYKEQGTMLAERAAIIAKAVVKESDHKVLVAGSLPPVFGSYRPDLFDGDRALVILKALFRAQNKYVDVWIAETISSIEEAMVMATVLRHTTKPCYYAFTLSDEIEQPAKLRSGELVTTAVQAMLQGNVDGIFFNCSIPEVIEQAIRDTTAVLKECHKKLKIGAFANSFTPILKGHKANEAVQGYRDLSPAEYLTFAKKWYALGANIIGGCCGIGPSHIEALVEWKSNINAS
jgi:S-methylmethionine-dependent homocysteine/selenocysteine methylase